MRRKARRTKSRHFRAGHLSAHGQENGTDSGAGEPATITEEISGLGGKFGTIYETGHWGKNAEGEGTSGGGSLPEQTVGYRAFLIQFIKDHQITSVVDAACGDWLFSRLIPWADLHVDYTGIDVVKDVVRKNQQRYGSDSIRFHVGSLTEPLPSADLLIAKDVLQHLSNRLVHKFIRTNLFPERVRGGQAPGYKYALITDDHCTSHTSECHENADIENGHWRPFSLQSEPFTVKSARTVFLFDVYVPDLVKATDLVDFTQPPAKDSGSRGETYVGVMQ
ncbi:unnamed protein product [Vitrella brassicaformis CCMP3155]|uniref:Methyltransferase type 11 domain-containing protein n=1 Tax=Vitrella brassicaformis (strain CCMP3155) TaxID=1169540 RepID=A0A0G4FE46_VITBC|nr:unnamed protein product [Vitrella brassicaformis CCMP3155]|eukprot:CEM11478.1 unnamed protein product [Vitrella brassicaformis CCMP3155]